MCLLFKYCCLFFWSCQIMKVHCKLLELPTISMSSKLVESTLISSPIDPQSFWLALDHRTGIRYNSWGSREFLKIDFCELTVYRYIKLLIPSSCLWHQCGKFFSGMSCSFHLALKFSGNRNAAEKGAETSSSSMKCNPSTPLLAEGWAFSILAHPLSFFTA